MPTSKALIACSLVIAGPFAILFVPWLIFLLIIPAVLRSPFTPMSTTTTSAWACSDKTQIPVKPFVMFIVCAAVISCGQELTPSS